MRPARLALPSIFSGWTTPLPSLTKQPATFFSDRSPGNTLWSGFGGACETDNDGQPTVNFDKLANVWVVSQYAISSGAPYLQCVAVSTTADATGTWNRYSFQIGIVNTAWTNLNAKLGVWPDGYYMTFDMYSGSTYLGPKLCALNRTKMISGNAAATSSASSSILNTLAL